MREMVDESDYGYNFMVSKIDVAVNVSVKITTESMS